MALEVGGTRLQTESPSVLVSAAEPTRYWCLLEPLNLLFISCSEISLGSCFLCMQACLDRISKPCSSGFHQGYVLSLWDLVQITYPVHHVWACRV